MTSELKVTVGQFSDKGRKPTNQDFHGIRLPKDSLLAIKGIAMAMADGISSSNVSAVAAETAVKSFLEDYYCSSETWSVKRSMERVLSATNSWLYAQTMRGEGRYDKDKGHVCTFSALVIKSSIAHVFHVGDTRVYHLSKNGLEQLTNDHRLWASEEKSYLSRALGMADPCEFDYRSLRVCIGDVFIIATDGIYEQLSSQHLIDTITKHINDLPLAAKTLAGMAYEQGSDDNLSVQLLRIEQLPGTAANEVKQKIERLPFPPSLRARMSFDGYRILRELHSNNRSHVYLVQDEESNEKRVLKAPASDIGSDANQLERFLMEEWVARRINNAHVLKADLADKQRNYIYTVFEYIEGQTLAQWAVDNPSPPIELVRDIIEQVAKGLHALHRKEMLHQDLRPENIMIDTKGTVKIIDFGSVSVAGIDEAAQASPLTYLAGTALYSAPEYFIGQPGSVRSELFSLGVICYFLLSGKYPYDVDVAKAKTLAAQKKLWYRSVQDDDREIPAWVDDAIHKAVHPLPERRYDELFEFIHDLRQPGKVFLDKTRPPLVERNPVALWQGISFILAVLVMYLLMRT